MKSVCGLIPLVGLFLSSCVVGPEHKPPEMTLPSKYAEGSPSANPQIAHAAWWTAFGDARLDGYIDMGLSDNLDILRAKERIETARADVTIAGAGALPGLNSNSSYSISGAEGVRGTGDEPTQKVAGSGLDAGFVLDLFGRYKRARQAALAQLDAAYADVDSARLSVLSQVAAAYVDVRYYQARVDLTRQNLASRRKTLSLTRLQLEAGAASRLDTIQAEGLVNSSLAEVPGLETELQRAAHRLATLLGRPASEMMPELIAEGRQPMPASRADAGIPADLIRNRPDIVAAERRLAAAIATIGVAEAQLYPSVSLGGSILARQSIIGGDRTRRLLAWSFGPELQLPIFDGGSLRANVTSAQSLARESYLAWKATVLAAVEEVENALAAVNRGRRTVASLRSVSASYEQALLLSTASYTDGASSLLDVLDAQRQVAAARANLADAIRQVAQDYISLNVSIGAGLTPRSTVRP